jgi:tetratricopeptide (TPR) repeat protein
MKVPAGEAQSSTWTPWGRRMRWWAMTQVLVAIALVAFACSAVEDADRTVRNTSSPPEIPTLAPTVAASLEPRVREAIDSAAAAVMRDPEAYDRWLALGMYLAANGLDDAAISVLESAERTKGADGRAPYFRALTYLELGRLEEAINALETASISSPERAQVWWRLGLASLEAGREADARAAIDRAIELDPAAAAAWAGRGRLALADGRAEDALAAFEESLRLDTAGRLPPTHDICKG